MALLGKQFRAEQRTRLGLDASPMPSDAHLGPVRYDSEAADARRLWELVGCDVLWLTDSQTWARWMGSHWDVKNDAALWLEYCARAIGQWWQLHVNELKAKLLAAQSKDERDEIEAQIKVATKRALWTASTRGITSMVRLLSGVDLGMVARLADFDCHSHMANTPTGTIDLRDFSIHPHKRSDRLSKWMIAPVDVPCPTWEAWCDDVTDGQGDYLRRCLGYAITGEVGEQCLFLLFGPTANGKSTLFRVLERILRDLQTPVPRSLLLEDERGRTRHPAEIMPLRGARCAHTSELPEDGRLDEAKMKALTGGDVVMGRGMGQNWISWLPTHKLLLGTNHLPKIKSDDEAVWRRIRVIRMPNRYWHPDDPKRPPEGRVRDETIEPRLLEEAGAIAADLAWQAARYYREGLPIPQRVAAELDAYRAEQDRIQDWIDECCAVGTYEKDSAKSLYRSYSNWCQDRGERAEGLTLFGGRLTGRGFGKLKTSGIIYRTGIRARPSGGWSDA